MPYQLKKTVVFVGMMGAGKTAVGGAVARKLGVPFIDQDDEIEKAANCTIAELFRDYGESFFREKETQVLNRLLHLPPCILSTGGGAYMADRNRQIIAENAVALWLKADLDLLWARVRHRSTRPLLTTANPYETLRGLVERRYPVYELAPLRVEAQPQYSVDQMAIRVIETLSDHPDILRQSDHAIR